MASVGTVVPTIAAGVAASAVAPAPAMATTVGATVEAATQAAPASDSSMPLHAAEGCEASSAAAALDDVLGQRMAALDAEISRLQQLSLQRAEAEEMAARLMAAAAEEEALQLATAAAAAEQDASAEQDVPPVDAEEAAWDLASLLSLYQGLPGALLKEGPPSALYLGVYEAAKTRLLATPLLGPYPLLVYLIAGALGETFGSLVRAPAEAIKARVQSGSDASTAGAFKSVLGNADGRTNVIQAWRSSLFRDVPFGAIQLAVFESLKAYLINSPATGGINVDTLYAEAALGATGGFIGSLLTTPPDVVTVRILTQKVGSEARDDESAAPADGVEDGEPVPPTTAAPRGFTQMANEILEQDGFGGLMTGWQARTGYWAPAIGIFLSCYCGSARAPSPTRPAQSVRAGRVQLSERARSRSAVRQFAVQADIFS